MFGRHPVDTAILDRTRLQRRTVRVLVGAQVLGGAATGAGAAVSPLLAKEILGDGTFAGVAFAALTFGGALAAVPLSRMMARRGRRPGLVRGYAVASLGAAAAIVSSEVRSFPLLLVGMLLFGVGTAASLLSRYAGADLAEPDRRARGIATVVWATTIGAVAGPNVLGPAGRVAEVMNFPRMAGPYVIAMLSFAGAALVVWALLRPDPLAVAGGLEPASTSDDRPSVAAQLRIILRIRSARLALVTMAVAHGVMVSLMTMTPLYLRDHGDSLEVVGVVFSLHIAGLYAFAPVIGTIADRVGHLRVAYGGALTLVAAAVLAAAGGHQNTLIGLALLLLGLGWSMGTISGSTLLTVAMPVEERAAVQGIADMTMGVVAGTGGTISGIVVGTVGYPALSLVGALIAMALLGVLVASRSSAEPNSLATKTTGRRPGRGGRLGRYALRRSRPVCTEIVGRPGHRVCVETDA
jgi:MFS family permease